MLPSKTFAAQWSKWLQWFIIPLYGVTWKRIDYNLRKCPAMVIVVSLGVFLATVTIYWLLRIKFNWIMVRHIQAYWDKAHKYTQKIYTFCDCYQTKSVNTSIFFFWNMIRNLFFDIKLSSAVFNWNFLSNFA